MSDLNHHSVNNDDVPSGNPSVRTVLIVLCSLALIVTAISFHSAIGL